MGYWRTYPRLEPIHKLDDMRVIQSLQHAKLIIYHLLISLDILLQYYLDCHFIAVEIGFSYNAIGACSERATEPVLGLLVVAVRLAVKFIHDSSN